MVGGESYDGVLLTVNDSYKGYILFLCYYYSCSKFADDINVKIKPAGWQTFNIILWETCTNKGQNIIDIGTIIS